MNFQAKDRMMLTFSYHFTPSIKFGCSLASKLGEELISVCDEKRVLIISDPGVIAAGLADAVLASLKKNGVAVDLHELEPSILKGLNSGRGT